MLKVQLCLSSSYVQFISYGWSNDVLCRSVSLCDYLVNDVLLFFCCFFSDSDHTNTPKLHILKIVNIISFDHIRSYSLLLRVISFHFNSFLVFAFFSLFRFSKCITCHSNRCNCWLTHNLVFCRFAFVRQQLNTCVEQLNYYDKWRHWYIPSILLVFFFHSFNFAFVRSM